MRTGGPRKVTLWQLFLTSPHRGILSGLRATHLSGGRDACSQDPSHLDVIMDYNYNYRL